LYVLNSILNMPQKKRTYKTVEKRKKLTEEVKRQVEKFKKYCIKC